MNKPITLIGAAVVAVVIAVVAVLIVVIGAGGGSAKDDGGSSQVGSSSGDSKAAGELRLAGDDPITLDPALAMDAGSALYIAEIFGGLLTIGQNLKLAPDIAREIPTRDNGGVANNSDGTVTYTFKIREGALFHDGRQVTADDVKYSIERAADPATRSVVADTYLGDIVGVRDKLRGKAKEVGGVKIVDDFTIKITIDSPKPYFLYRLTYPTAFVVDKRQVEGNPRNWTRKPNATGPFKVKEWRLGERLTLEANERYHLGAPKLKTIRFELAGGSGMTRYENGDLDVTGVSLDDIERVLEPSDPLNAQYQSGDRLSVDYIGFNTTKPPFDDPKVRQAFAKAIDREKIAEVVLKGVIPVASGLVPAGMPGYESKAKTLDFDPEAAKKLLAESKYKGPEGLPPITMAESGAGATVGPTSQAIVEMWRQNLGVTVEIQQAESATFFSDIDTRAYQMFHIGWIVDYPDPENVLDILFYSESEQNSTGYDSPQVDDLLERARREENPAKRFDLYHQAEQMIIDDAPWAPLYFDRYHALVKPYVKGYTFPAIIIPKFRYVSLEK